jgi:hypothetical protein
LFFKICQYSVNIGLQLKHKEDQVATMVPELPWTTPKEKPTPGQEQTNWRKGRRTKKVGGFFDAIMFAVGLGLAGARFLLGIGWTLGGCCRSCKVIGSSLRLACVDILLCMIRRFIRVTMAMESND